MLDHQIKETEGLWDINFGGGGAMFEEGMDLHDMLKHLFTR